jgi:hypothetical protein
MSFNPHGGSSAEAAARAIDLHVYDCSGRAPQLTRLGA